MKTTYVTSLTDAVIMSNQNYIEVQTENNNVLIGNDLDQLESLVSNSEEFDSVVYCTKPLPKPIVEITNKKAPFTLYTFNNKCSRNSRGKIHSLSDFMLSLAIRYEDEQLIEIVDLNKPDNLKTFKETPFYNYIVDQDKSEFVLVHRGCIVDFEIANNYPNKDVLNKGYQTYKKIVPGNQHLSRIIVSLVDPNRHLVRSTYSTSNAKYGMDTFPYLYELFETSVNKFVYRSSGMYEFYKALTFLIKAAKHLQEPIFEPLPQR